MGISNRNSRVASPTERGFLRLSPILVRSQPDVKQGAYSSLKRVLGLVGPFTRIGVLEELMESAQDDAVRAYF